MTEVVHSLSNIDVTLACSLKKIFPFPVYSNLFHHLSIHKPRKKEKKRKLNKYTLFKTESYIRVSPQIQHS